MNNFKIGDIVDYQIIDNNEILASGTVMFVCPVPKDFIIGQRVGLFHSKDCYHITMSLGRGKREFVKEIEKHCRIQ